MQDTRPVLAPPPLVALLREYVRQFRVAPEGRIFRAQRGNGLITDIACSRTWQLARQKALTPTQAASPLAGRPYDLRHAAVSLWLNAGIPRSASPE